MTGLENRLAYQLERLMMIFNREVKDPSDPNVLRVLRESSDLLIECEKLRRKV